MKMPGAVPQASDSAIPHDLEPLIYPDVDWVANIVTPFELIEKSKDDLNVKRSAIPNSQRKIGDIYLGILNHEQQFSVAIVRHRIRRDERLLMKITGVQGTGKTTLYKRSNKSCKPCNGKW